MTSGTGIPPPLDISFLNENVEAGETVQWVEVMLPSLTGTCCPLTDTPSHVHVLSHPQALMHTKQISKIII